MTTMLDNARQWIHGSIPTCVEPPESELIRRNRNALAILAVALGVVTIACHLESGPRRWSAAIWQGPLQVPGAPATWGVVILLAGLLMTAGIFGHRYSYACYQGGAWISFWWMIFVAAWQLVTLMNDPTGTANPVWLPLWTYLAFIYLSRIRYAKRRFRER